MIAIQLMAKRSHERMERLSKLENEGNFKDNAIAIASGSGEFRQWIVGGGKKRKDYNIRAKKVLAVRILPQIFIKK